MATWNVFWFTAQAFKVHSSKNGSAVYLYKLYSKI